MKIEKDFIVELKNGKRGIVSTIKNQPWLIVFSNFTALVSKYNENLEHPSDNYTIVKMWDTTDVEFNVNDVWKKNLDTSKFNLVFERNN